MSISKRLSNYEPARKGGSCRVCVLLRTLPKAESAALSDALGDARFSNSGLARILTDEGFSVGASTVSRHRRGECKP